MQFQHLNNIGSIPTVAGKFFVLKHHRRCQALGFRPLYNFSGLLFIVHNAEVQQFCQQLRLFFRVFGQRH